MLVKGRHPTNGKAIPPVNIGHGDGMADNARRVRHIRYLLQALIVLKSLHHALTGKDQPIYPHLALTWQAPAVLIETLHCDAVCYSHTLSPFFSPSPTGRGSYVCSLGHCDTPCWVSL